MPFLSGTLPLCAYHATSRLTIQHRLRVQCFLSLCLSSVCVVILVDVMNVVGMRVCVWSCLCVVCAWGLSVSLCQCVCVCLLVGSFGVSWSNGWSVG